LHQFGLTMLIGISVIALITPVFCRGAVGSAD
jgi:hypothetical protein